MDEKEIFEICQSVDSAIAAELLQKKGNSEEDYA